MDNIKELLKKDIPEEHLVSAKELSEYLDLGTSPDDFAGLKNKLLTENITQLISKLKAPRAGILLYTIAAIHSYMKNPPKDQPAEEHDTLDSLFNNLLNLYSNIATPANIKSILLSVMSSGENYIKYIQSIKEPSAGIKPLCATLYSFLTIAATQLTEANNNRWKGTFLKNVVGIDAKSIIEQMGDMTGKLEGIINVINAQLTQKIDESINNKQEQNEVQDIEIVSQGNNEIQQQQLAAQNIFKQLNDPNINLIALIEANLEDYGKIMVGVKEQDVKELEEIIYKLNNSNDDDLNKTGKNKLKAICDTYLAARVKEVDADEDVEFYDCDQGIDQDEDEDVEFYDCDQGIGQANNLNDVVNNLQKLASQILVDSSPTAQNSRVEADDLIKKSQNKQDLPEEEKVKLLTQMKNLILKIQKILVEKFSSFKEKLQEIRGDLLNKNETQSDKNKDKKQNKL